MQTLLTTWGTILSGKVTLGHSQEIHHIFFKLKSSFPCSQQPPSFPILEKIHTVIFSYSISFRSILILSSHLGLSYPSFLFPLSCSSEANAFIFYPIQSRTLRPFHPLDLVILLRFGDDYNLGSSSLSR
jgi:hypothetical protein